MGHAKSKVFNGKRYTFQHAYSMKVDARREAKRLRKLGYNARVIVSKNMSMSKRYAVYVK